MEGVKKDISLYRGDTLQFTVAFKDIENLTVGALFFSVKRSERDTLYAVQKSIGNGIVEVEPLKFRVRLAPEDTQNLRPGAYVHDLRVGMGADVKTIMSGAFTLLSDVTREVL